MEKMSGTRVRETISECISDARSGSLERQQRALKTLVTMTKVSPSNRTLLAQVDGAISVLLSIAKSTSAALQATALSILFNLSLNPDLKFILADMDTIHNLNSIFAFSSSPDSTRLVLSLICSLAMLDKNKAKFGVAGTVQMLVKAVSGGSRGLATHHLLSSLAELVQFHGNCTLAVKSGAISVLLQLVDDTECDDLMGTSLAILSLLARFDEGLCALMETDQIVICMVRVLKGRCMLSKEGATEVLLRLFDESDGCVRDALKVPELSTVLADLSVRGSSRAREKSTLLMKKMMEVDSNGNSMLYKW